jgi:serine/threonine protein kinase/tetratricopeptide (TPR) repeat protein
MDPAEWKKIKDLFNTAIDLPESERDQFLERCEPGIRLEVEKLIVSDREAANFIREPVMVEIGLPDEEKSDFYIGKQIDSYKIIREIGRGGMGAVYLANRADESFDKPVALKLIKRGMDTSAVLKRFMMERQILAQLQHPNIASLLDGGTTTDGLPYFVMEYVEGEPVTKFCDGHGFSIEQRLELFQKVCSAITHAHQNLVIHRDIKPSNILVTEDGTPKLLDFGIAKLLHPDWSLDTAEATATMFRVMTPEYASPEQIRGQPVTTASDVYSLGVVLYELLSGERPYRIDNRLPDEIARIVLTAEPVKPSSVVSYSISEGGIQNADLETNENEKPGTKNDEKRSGFRYQQSAIRNLKGDLDNIILKSLRKEPERRYAFVHELSEDIRRYLAGQPVTATADTAIYRIGKFAKRHRAGVFAGASILVALFTATGVTTWQSIVAKRERDRAEQRFAQVRKLANAVLFEYHDGIRKLAGSTSIRQKMVEDALEYLDNLTADSSADQGLRRELASAYEKVGDVQSGDDSFGTLNNSKGASISYQKALKLREEISASSPGDQNDLFDLAVCYRQVGDSLGVGGDLSGRLAHYQKGIKIHEALVLDSPSNQKFQQGLAGGSYDLGVAYDQTGDNANAIINYERAVEIWQRLSADGPPNSEPSRKLSKAYKFLGAILLREGRKEEAVANYQKAIELDGSRVAFDDTDSQAKLDLSASNMVFANLYLKTGDLRFAEEFCRKGLEIRKELNEIDPQNTDVIAFLARAYDTLGQIEQKKQNLKGAIENYRQAIAIFTQPQRADSSDFLSDNYLAIFHKNLAAAYEELSAKPAFLKDRRQNLRLAKENYQKTFEIVKKLQEHGTITSWNSNKLEEIQQKINLCDLELKKT